MTRSKTYTARYELRLTQEEKTEWSNKAAEVGLDLSNYIRRCVERRQISNPKIYRPTRLEQDTAYQLGKIGSNLNQQIRAMNAAIASGQDIPNVEESLAVVNELFDLVQTIQTRLLLGEDPE